MVAVPACRCGHGSLRHYNGARVGRTGPCKERACLCRQYVAALLEPQSPSN